MRESKYILLLQKKELKYMQFLHFFPSFFLPFSFFLIFHTFPFPDSSMRTNQLNISQEFSVSPIYPVLIISYEMFIRSMDEIKDIKFDLLICDEAHRLKNSYIKTTTVQHHTLSKHFSYESILITKLDVVLLFHWSGFRVRKSAFHEGNWPHQLRSMHCTVTAGISNVFIDITSTVKYSQFHTHTKTALSENLEVDAYYFVYDIWYRFTCCR